MSRGEEPTRWALWARGRLRPRIELADGGADALAELTMRGRRGVGGGHADDREGVRWVVETRPDASVSVLRDGVRWFAADGESATFGGERLSWDRSGESVRRATVLRADGRPLVQVRPGLGRRAPFAVVDVDPGEERALPVALGVLFALLESDAIYNAWTSAAGTSTGP
jgi:hypothetical protein